MPSNKVTVKVKLDIKPRPDSYHRSPFYADLRSSETYSTNTFLGKPIIVDSRRCNREVYSMGDAITYATVLLVLVFIGSMINPIIGAIILFAGIIYAIKER